MSKFKQIIVEAIGQYITDYHEPKLPFQKEIKGIGNGLQMGKLGMQEWLEMMTKIHDKMIDDDMSLEEVNAIDRVFRKELADQLS